MRYKRRRYGRRSSTKVIRMKFQSFMDISTNDTSMQIITISAGGPEILRRLSPQFGAYKYYKIGNISCKLVPASTLPVDPTGLSYNYGEGAEMTVDPRDQLTPGLMRITNGEDVFENISGLDSDTQHAIYNNMLLDPRWYKWMLQSGVKRHATPRYWQIGQLHQDKWPGSILNVPDFAYQTSVQDTTTVANASKSTGPFQYASQGSSPHGFFQVGHRGVLGWLPTDGLALHPKSDGSGMTETPFMASPPEVEVMKIILPKAYKTRYYYRMFITETVYFKEPIVNFGIPALTSGGTELAVNPLDVFHHPAFPVPHSPGNTYAVQYPRNGDTGGNYGDD